MVFIFSYTLFIYKQMVAIALGLVLGKKLNYLLSNHETLT